MLDQIDSSTQIFVGAGMAARGHSRSRWKTRAGLCTGAATVALAVLAFIAGNARASFGIVPDSFKTVALERNGTVDARAGSHPYEYNVSFAINQSIKGEPEGELRDVEVDLPPGLVGNPLAVPRCTRQEFEGQQALCPGDTQVGVVRAELAGLGIVEVPVFNLVPPPGVPARLGFSAVNLNGLEDASVLTGAGYGVAVSADNIPAAGAIVSVSETIWGVPPDEGHDPERHCISKGQYNEKGEFVAKGTLIEGCPSEVVPRPFLALPTSCTGPLTTTLRADSVEAPGHFVTEQAVSRDAGNNPVGLSGCEKLPFKPEFELAPDTATAESPSGLNVELKIPQPESPEGLAESHLKEAVVKLPAGMTVSPSAANGLAACALEGPEGINLKSAGPANCPNASKVGSVEIETPLLEHAVKGSVFVAQQGNLLGNGSNPFGSLLALYIVAEGEGVVVKLPGEVKLEENGQLTARFGRDPVTGEEFLPQLPFDDLKMSFFGGPRAALITPSSCGAYTTSATLTPWNGGPPVQSSSSFTIDQGCEHGFGPSFVAGTTNPQAGGYSPLAVTFSRRDGEQRFAGVQVTEPPGLIATLKNVAQCPEPQASQGECAPESLIGETAVAAGPGEDPFWVTGGKVYLTGPYKGSPFGLSIVVPAVAGPFNIGERGGIPDGKPVVVRARIDVDPHTAQAIVTSDSLPTILQNVPLDVRTINVTINRPGFIFNPTNCSPLATTAIVTSTTETKSAASSPFEAANCAALPFKPSFKVSTQGKTSKADGASLTVNVAAKPGEVNIQKVDLQLPLILPARLTTLQKACTAAQFDTNPAGCPEASNIGVATAVTPVLSVPLTGPAYLVSHGGAAFPDVEFVLQGEGVEVILDGGTDIKKGITYSKFETVPDAPISSFQTVLPEGPHSALAANGNLCSSTKTVSVRKRVTIRVHGRTKRVTKTVKHNVPQPLTIPTTLIGQNGAVLTQNTQVTVTGCPKIKTVTKNTKRRRK